jgi:hypothetical protein
MKRQRGRNRGGGGGGGKPQQQNANRAFDSNGPEGIKVRGNAQHVFEKYQQLARDAASSGDRVLAENYLQHAEHYFRLLRAMQPTRPAAEILGRDQFSSGFDIDFEDEAMQAQAEAADAAAAERANGQAGEASDGGESWGGDRGRDDRQRFERDDRPRGDRFEGQGRDGQGREGQGREGQAREGQAREGQAREAQGGRRDRWRDDRGPRLDRDDRGSRDERPRFERDDRGPREDRPRFERNRDERQERDPLAVVEPQAQPLVSDERPSPVLRDAEGGESHAPAFLQQAASPRTEPAEDAPRPRRRRTPRGGAAPEIEEG